MTFEHYYAERVAKWKPLSPLWQGNGAITEEIRAAYEAGATSRDAEVEALRKRCDSLQSGYNKAHEIFRAHLNEGIKRMTTLNKGEG